MTTLGLILEWNDCTGVAYLPSGRIGWKAVENRLVRAAVTRGVPAPPRFVFTRLSAERRNLNNSDRLRQVAGRIVERTS